MNLSVKPYTMAGIAVLFGLILVSDAEFSLSQAADDTHKTAAQDFQSFCATCHGWGGAGGGPVADVLSVEVRINEIEHQLFQTENNIQNIYHGHIQ